MVAASLADSCTVVYRAYVCLYPVSRAPSPINCCHLKGGYSTLVSNFDFGEGVTYHFVAIGDVKACFDVC